MHLPQLTQGLQENKISFELVYQKNYKEYIHLINKIDRIFSALNRGAEGSLGPDDVIILKIFFILQSVQRN